MFPSIFNHKVGLQIQFMTTKFWAQSPYHWDLISEKIFDTEVSLTSFFQELSVASHSLP